MKPNPKIAAAVAAVLGAPATAIVVAAPADTTETAGGNELTEVVVTAERRAERMQDVPITIQAITGDQLKQLNVVSFQDLLKYTPNVTFSGNGPGTGNIFMRGLGGIGSGNQSQSTTAAFPNVALYLDDQSMQFPARNLDVYVIDMERIEVLEGPQGTLFGGGAQAGAIRYITNKPNLAGTSAEFNVSYGTTAHGSPNSSANGVLNVPLIPDVFGIRAVVFSDHRGGYIDNVPSTIAYQPGTPEFATGVTANNAYTLGNATNTINYSGFRLSALYKMSDSWDLLLQQNYQDMRADGYFYAYPADSNGTTLANYQITAFTPAFNKDRYESTSWTLNGKLPANMSVVYTGSYLSRNIDGQQDYSNYLRSGTGSYYGCIGPGAGYFNPGNFPALATHKLQCYAPVGAWEDIVHNTHMSHEIRFSTDQDQRIRALAGFFWEKFVIDDNMNFNYLSIPQCATAAQAAAGLAGTGPDCLSAVGPVPGTYSSVGSLRTNINDAFGEDEQRGYKQRAFFASADFDLIPKVLTLTGGGRLYHYDEWEHGSEWYSESTSGASAAGVAPGTGLILDHVNGTCINTPGYCGFPMDLNKTESGSRWRGNLTWHITPDILTYYTFSQGFRPGSFNRTNSSNGMVFLKQEIPFCVAGVVSATFPAGCPKNTYQYEKPAGVNSDNLINNEIGFKSEFFQHRLLFNASVYYMKWQDEQLSLFEPAFFGNTTFNVQGPNFLIKGFEVQFVARITDGLSFQGSSSVNQASQTNSPCLESVGVDPNNPKTANNPVPKGQCIAVDKGVPLVNALGAYGTSPAFSPPWMFNARLRYDWEMSGYKPFIWAGASHIGPMTNEPRNYHPGDNPIYGSPPVTTLLLYNIPSYTTYDGAIGIAKDNWTIALNGSNLGNAYGPTNITSGQFIKAEIPLRPRVIDLGFSYKF
ncbi:MAG: TonB-dependent receptor plug domain-containing protein [Gammaproteobacteria bacterium]|nr:TonB-dependent receptor plug domain-containing protein [Gammaproteobacteria bacterium]MBV8496436.1 TonB-dependent receptor plug domain-containing protein [Gammaproteobacteria bacterium]